MNPASLRTAALYGGSIEEEMHKCRHSIPAGQEVGEGNISTEVPGHSLYVRVSVCVCVHWLVISSPHAQLCTGLCTRRTSQIWLFAMQLCEHAQAGS